MADNQSKTFLVWKNTSPVKMNNNTHVLHLHNKVIFILMYMYFTCHSGRLLMLFKQ